MELQREFRMQRGASIKVVSPKSGYSDTCPKTGREVARRAPNLSWTSISSGLSAAQVELGGIGPGTPQSASSQDSGSDTGVHSSGRDIGATGAPAACRCARAPRRTAARRSVSERPPARPLGCRASRVRAQVSEAVASDAVCAGALRYVGQALRSDFLSRKGKTTADIARIGPGFEGPKLGRLRSNSDQTRSSSAEFRAIR